MRSLVLLSGGLDSTVLLYYALAQRKSVRAFSFDYGQRHRRELASARDIAGAAKVPHYVVALTSLRAFIAKGALVGDSPVPRGHYTDESMKETIVPNRNMVMLAVAVAVAIAGGDEEVLYAAHAGDHTIYPDCRSEFVEALAKAVELCDWSPPKLAAPFLQLTKADIVRRGIVLNAPLHLTWSCYEGGWDHHCGKCGTCIERQEAFQLANVKDPTRYTGGPNNYKCGGTDASHFSTGCDYE